MKFELVSTMILVMFLFHPEIFRYMTSAFACTEIDSSEYWLVQDLDIRCWNSEHSVYASGLALPGLILWGIGLPLLAFIFIMKNRKHLEDDRVKARFQFLLVGYKPNLYYWEFVIMYRKMGIVLISVFLSTVGDGVQGLAAFLML